MRRVDLLHAISAFFLLCAGSLHAQGKLEIVGGDTHDWGTVAPGKLTAVVELKNVGSEDLNVLEVRPTCLCTIAPIDKNLLKPGEVARIDVTLDATTKAGPLERNIVIRSSDPDRPQQTLRLKATLTRDLTFTPSSYFVVEGGRRGVEMPATPIVVTNTGNTPFTIHMPGAPQGNFKARFDMPRQVELKPGEKFELKAFITPLADADISGTIKMKTSSPQTPFADLFVTGTMAQDDKSQSH
jgi:Protein of unknown function (DUF1573)